MCKLLPIHVGCIISMQLAPFLGCGRVICHLSSSTSYTLTSEPLTDFLLVCFVECYFLHPFSEELLLQDDGSDVSSVATEFSKGMQLGQALLPTESPGYVRRANHISSTSFVPTHR